MRLDRPKQSTLFVDLVGFSPGQPETIMNGTNGHSSHHPGLSQPSHNNHMQKALPAFSLAPGSTSVPPPPWPPWSRWGVMATPSAPPLRRHSSEVVGGQPSRKRRLPDESSEDIRHTSPGAAFPKRRLITDPPPSTASTTPSQAPSGSPSSESPSLPRQSTLSPSLAIMMNPSSYDASPRPRPQAI